MFVPTYPIYGNNLPTMTLDQVLALDLHSNYPCHFCGKSIIVQEGFIEGTDDDAYLLCDFCVQYSTFAEVYAEWGVIADEAINPENSDAMGYPWV